MRSTLLANAPRCCLTCRERYLAGVTYLTSRAYPSSILASEPTLIQDPSTVPILIPGLDSLNHARGAAVTWAVTYPVPNHPVLSGQSRREPLISVVLHDPVKPHQEIFNNYGPKPNSEFILGYGFSFCNNPDDSIILKIGGINGQRWSIGRGAYGVEGLWAEIVQTISTEGGYEDQLDAAGLLQEMCENLLDKLPRAGAGGNYDMRPEVALMLQHYVKAKGKKRACAAYNESRRCPTKRSASSSLSSLTSSSEVDAPPALPKNKRPKRAETRKCPVCEESIPLRLLSKHLLLEEERVDGIIQQIGSAESVEQLNDLQTADGPGSSMRRSALKARKFFLSSSSSADSVEQAAKIIQGIKRHRKQRHTRLRDLTRDLDDDATSSGTGTSHDSSGFGMAAREIHCPVCMGSIHGDEDVLEAHIDACLAHQAERAETEQMMEQSDMDSEGAGHVGNVTGTGFHTRNPEEQDVEDEVDIDGDDQDVYGEPQFTEGDLIALIRDGDSDNMDEFAYVEIEDGTEDEMHSGEKTLQDLVAEGRRATSGDGVEAIRAKMNEVMGVGDTERLDSAIAAAQNKGDKVALISALENKIKLLETMRVSSTSSLVCRICLDPYSEATVSTGCWHTCCRECWLRCLGSTKLCPICKRITGATDLRRIYL
ncbi:hypothetical protein APHAL10511_001670 [Amanita phalloides]|nr:hypothetical protein APHAL10511_001670 [Amanita phalloides]